MKKRGIKYKIAILFVAMVIIISSKAYAKSDIIVMLDPGHGGNDSGAVGGGLLEKNINWKIASRVKQILDNTPGITGILTKSEDETLDKNLDRRIRADRAKNNNADLAKKYKEAKHTLAEKICSRILSSVPACRRSGQHLDEYLNAILRFKSKYARYAHFCIPSLARSSLSHPK